MVINVYIIYSVYMYINISHLSVAKVQHFRLSVGLQTQRAIKCVIDDVISLARAELGPSCPERINKCRSFSALCCCLLHARWYGFWTPPRAPDRVSSSHRAVLSVYLSDSVANMPTFSLNLATFFRQRPQATLPRVHWRLFWYFRRLTWKHASSLFRTLNGRLFKAFMILETF